MKKTIKEELTLREYKIDFYNLWIGECKNYMRSFSHFFFIIWNDVIGNSVYHTGKFL